MPPQNGHDGYRFRQGWGSATRAEAANQIRSQIADETDLLEASEALAEEMAKLFAADACSVSLLDDTGYRDLVNVGDLDETDSRFPDGNHRFPVSQFPLSTGLLLDGTGYLSTNSQSALYREFQGMWPQMPDGSFMGVPIVAGGRVSGELYLARGHTRPPFTPEDLQLARDVATAFGSALPRLLEGS
jgi:GAF domain-containing protein